MAYLVVAFYQFVALPDCQAWRSRLYDCCVQHNIMGTILLATEGINGTVCGAESDIRALLTELRADPRLANLQVKESWDEQPSFRRLKVRVKREIVTLGQPQVDPTRRVGTYVKPEDWNALISNPDVLVVDVRNQFEVSIGTFKGAIDPQTNAFREFPQYVEQLDPQQHRQVAMFCTGGIRCEKASAYMLSQGFEQVYHLEGGILKYLETVPATASLWEGECFVFDQRVALTHGVDTGSYGACPSCGNPIAAADRASPKYQHGVSCPHCHDRLTDDQRQRFTERQYQRELQHQRELQRQHEPQQPRSRPAPLGESSCDDYADL
jgi:UPF0176 protein